MHQNSETPHLEDCQGNDAKWCLSCCCIGEKFGKICKVMLYITIVLSVLVVIPISVYPTGAFIAGWATCPYRFSNSKGDICSMIAINDNTEPDIVLRDSGDGLINTNNTKEIQKFIDLTRIAILFSTLANGVSQIFFLLALICLFLRHYKRFRELNWNWWKECKLYCCCIRDEVNDKSIKPLDPFNDDHGNEFIEPTSIAVVY